MTFEVEQLKQIDAKLIALLKKAAAFDFAQELSKGKTLLVGEGNLSFTLSLAATGQIPKNNLTATTYEKPSELSEVAEENTRKLKSFGVNVLHNVDATRLASFFGNSLFNHVVFQFPNTGTREPVEGHNPNFILVRDFLKSAYNQLSRGSRVLITVVDNSYYQGAFQFEEAAELAGFSAPDSYPFDPSDFPEYDHTMTHQEGSAIDKHTEFRTWVFVKN